MKMRKFVLIATVVLLVCGCRAFREMIMDPGDNIFSIEERKSMNRDEDVLKMRLDNGLDLAVQENHSVPVVGLNVWVKVGSADEAKGEEGIAHVHEHMLFKGTETRGVGEIAKEVEAMGGDINAFTSMDYTVYYIVVASRFFDEALDILADALQHSSFDAEELDKELKVILEELQRGEDNPRRKIYDYFFEQAYREHPYKRPIIGYRQTVAALAREDVTAFFNKWYQPRNMVVAAAGDVDRDYAARRIKEKFGSATGKDLPESPREVVEPEQEKMRVKFFREDVMEGYMYLGFHIPAFGHEDMAALDVLSVVLGTGESSRLMERVRSKKRLVSNIWSYAYTPRNPGMLMVGSNFMPEKLTAALEETLRQIYLLTREEIPAWELERAKRHVESESIYQRETVQGDARRVGFLVSATGDPFYEEKYLEKVRKLDVNDLREAASRYLTSSNLTVTAIIPKKAEADLTEESLKDAVQRAAAVTDEDDTAKAQDVELPKQRKTGARSGYGEPVKYTLPNGIQLIIRENHTVPLVSLRAAFLGGLRVESREKNGLVNFMAEVITEGTESYTSENIHRSIEAMAGNINGFSGNNTYGVTMDVLSAYFDEAFGIFTEVIRSPVFPREEVEKARMIILSQIRAQQDQPMRVATDQYRALLYPSHPYGMKTLGEEETVKAISREDIIGSYERFSRPSNLVIGVAGDVDAKHIKALFESGLGDWEDVEIEFPQIPLEPAPEDVRKGVICMERGQSNIVLGFQGPRFNSEDNEAVEVMTGVLSGMGGRLFTVLRDRSSLAYSVYANQIEGIEPGFLYVYIGTSPDREDEAVQGILGILGSLRSEGVTDEELVRAKNMLIGNFEIGLQRNSSWAARMVFDELYGLGFDNYQSYSGRIEAVDKNALFKSAEKYLNPEAYVLSIVRPCDKQQLK